MRRSSGSCGILARMQELASERTARRVDLDAAIATDWGRGAVSIRRGPQVHRRAEPGGLVVEACSDPDGVTVTVYGPPGEHDAGAALASARGWAGLDDDPGDFGEVVAAHPVLRELHGRIGTPLLSRLPRVEEALGRAFVHQLVQGREARRSCNEIALRIGTQVDHDLWSWPSGQALRHTPDWALRRCGVSARTAQGLRAAAVHAGRLEAARSDWALLDRRMRALPGCGAWTSGTARLALGDPDAVPEGDYNLPSLVGHVLAGEPADDAGMASLLAPFAGHRGRVLRLLTTGAGRGLVSHPRRTAPRAALSAHRYW